MDAKPCVNCKTTSHIQHTSDWYNTMSGTVYDHMLYCTNCYDGAPDAGRNLSGSATCFTREASRIEAIENWNEEVEDYNAAKGAR